MGERTCSVDGCPDPTKARGYCNAHYQRWRKSGDPTFVTRPRNVNPAAAAAIIRMQGLEPVEPFPGHGARWRVRCLICGAESRPWGTHVLRGKSGCRPCRMAAKREASRTDANPKWKGDAASYSAVHHRLRAMRGPASDFPCIDCGGPAEEWSYIGGDPDEVRESGRGSYSFNPLYYRPRCAPDHRRFDRRR